MGAAERDGMTLAVEEINAQGGVGGRKLELIVEDNLSEAKSAVSTVQKLIKFDTPELRSLYERNGMITTWHGFVKDDPTSFQREFIDRFKIRFKETHLATAAYAYDEIYALAEALKPCLTLNGVNQPCLAAELLKTDYNGVAGRLIFNQYGISTRKHLLIQLKDGKWRKISQVH